MGLVFVVEDDRGCCLTLAGLIRRTGHQAKSACSAMEALALLMDVSASLPDLLIIDYSMPEMDGLTFLSKLRSHPRTEHVPVIIFSGCDDPEIISNARMLGVNEYWVKSSFEFGELGRRLNRYAPFPEPANQSTQLNELVQSAR